MTRLLSTILLLAPALVFGQADFSEHRNWTYDPDNNNETKTPTGSTRLPDDFNLFFGTGADYAIQYDLTNTQLEIWSTDTDGGGTDGNLVYVPDGTDDWHFAGDAFLDKETANLPVRLNGSSQLVGQQIDGGASSTEDDILDGSIPNTDLANTTVSYGGVTVSLGGKDPTPAFDLQDATNIPEKREVQTVTIADDTTGGSSPSQQVTPSAAIVEITNNDPDGATVTLDDTSATNGDIVWILNANGSAASLTLSDDTGNSDPTLELWTSDITLEQRELFAVEFNAAAGWWREVGRANGEVSTLADTIEGVSNPDGDIDLVPGNDISITGDDGANTITIASSLIRNLENPGGNIDIQGDGRVAVTDDGTSIITIDGGTLEGLSNAGGNIDLAGGANISISDDGSSVITFDVSPQGSGSGLDADTTDGQDLGTGDDVEHNSLTVGEFAGDKAVISNGSGRLAESTTTTNQLDIVSRVPGGREPRNGLHWNGTDNSQIEISSDASYDNIFNEGGTLRLIFNREAQGDTSSADHLLRKDSDFIVRFLADSQTIQFFVDFDTSNGQWTVANVPFDETQDVVIAYDGSDTSNDPTIWINGESQSVTEASTPSGSASDGSGNPLWVGSRNTSSTAFNGDILHLSLLNYAVSAADVSQAFETGEWAYEFGKASQVQLINDVSRNSDFTAAGTDWASLGASGGITHDTTNDELDVTATDSGHGGKLGTAEFDEAKKGRRVEATINVTAINLDGANSWQLTQGSSGTGTVLVSGITSTGEQTADVILDGDGDNDIQLKISGTATTQASISISEITYHRVGETLRLELDAGIGFQVHDTSGNGNHGAKNLASTPTWIKQEDRGQIRTVGATANQSLLNTTVAALPANVLIESIAVASSSTDAPGDFWVGTASETVSDNAITIPEDIGASEHVSFQIIDTLPGQGSNQDLFINSDDWGEEALDIVINYSRYENNF